MAVSALAETVAASPPVSQDRGLLFGVDPAANTPGAALRRPANGF